MENTTQTQNLESILTETEITRLINEGACKVSALAEQYSVKPEEVKKVISSVMNDRIVFRRGRNGGVKWNNQ